jgi:type IV pilus assembly protein PilY1
MIALFTRTSGRVLLLIVAGFFGAAALAGQPSLVPPHLTQTVDPPLNMINMARDDQLYYKAYNDFTDIDPQKGDGLEKTYKHSFDYFGYFDSYKCYDYSTANNRFFALPLVTTVVKDANGSTTTVAKGAADSTPGSITTTSGGITTTITTSATSADKYCAGAWSGNFLNWATMARIDIVRKILFGGLRSTDDNAVTVLERAYIPTDSHAWVKYYKNDDIGRLTPFANVNEISLCNLTTWNGQADGTLSAANTNPPLMRVANGNYALWNGNEVVQCQWNEEYSNYGNSNDPALSGLQAEPFNPVNASKGLGSGYARSGRKGEYVVRVEACPAGLTGKEKCRRYPNGSIKPIGLLQQYGENQSSLFGLMTGSFTNNKQGGVLRKKMGAITDEVDVNTGRFTGTAGIISNLDALRMIEEKAPAGYNGNAYRDAGNPFGEIYVESLRYLAGARSKANAQFDYVGNNADASLPLTKVGSWNDPFKKTNGDWIDNASCRRLNVINFNTSVPSWDNDQMSIADLNPGGATIAGLTRTIGDREHITGNQFFVGRSGGAASGPSVNDLCTGKVIDDFSTALGICPDSPQRKGSYLIAGAAYHAHVNPIRTDITDNPKPDAFKVNTYSVALASGDAIIEVPVPGYPKARVSIVPAGFQSGGVSGRINAFVPIAQDVAAGTGSFLAQMDQVNDGSDFDLDVRGLISYRVEGTKIHVTTRVIGGYSSAPSLFGYFITGTVSKDGSHFHSGYATTNYGSHLYQALAYADPANIAVTSAAGPQQSMINASGGCERCDFGDAATTAVYDIATNGASSTGRLNDPLWYATKYGNFKRTDDVPWPDKPEKWDRKTITGDDVPAGIPYGYFYATDPRKLESSLEEIFQQILDFGAVAPAFSTSAVALNSIAFETRYLQNDVAGQMHAYAMLPDGSNGELLFEASSKLGEVDASERVVITSRAGTGMAFRWDSLSAAQKTALRLGGDDAIGSNRVDYLRGDQSHEAPDNVNFRRRITAQPLGPLVNSMPWYVGAPDAGFSDALHPGYAAYRAANFQRRGVVYIASNDGMLHGFDAKNGIPLLSYLPDYLLEKAARSTVAGFAMSALFDGMPFAGDVDLGTADAPAWRTYLFAPLGRGGHGIVALDVTNPGTIAADKTQADFIGNEANAAQVFKWEFSDRFDSDLGNIISRPQKNAQGGARQVVQLQDGRWVVLLGNGYNSDAADDHAGSGDAVLFMLNVAGPTGVGGAWVMPTDYVKITTRNPDAPGGGPGAGPNNGLGLPYPLDTDGDGKVDVIYAADYKGNLWKFVDANRTGSWSLAYGAPFYTAVSSNGAAQPVSGGISIRKHPLGGYMIVFGTGRSIESGDAQAAAYAESIYGIWDRDGAVAGISGRGRLLQQRVEFTTADGKYRITSDKKISDWTNYDGWYLDLPGSGEKIIDNISIRNGGVAAFSTISSTTNAADSCVMTTAGFPMLVDALTGSSLDLSFDTDGDDRVDGNDKIKVVVNDDGQVIRLATAADLRAAPDDGKVVEKNPNGIRVDGSPGYASEQKNASGARRHIRVDCNAAGATHGANGYCYARTAELAGARIGRINWREVLRNQ